MKGEIDVEGVVGSGGSGGIGETKTCARIESVMEDGRGKRTECKNGGRKNLEGSIYLHMWDKRPGNQHYCEDSFSSDVVAERCFCIQRGVKDHKPMKLLETRR